LVIIWLKRCLATSLTEPVLESVPVGQGGAAAVTALPPGLSSVEKLLNAIDLESSSDMDVEVDVDVEVEVGVDTGVEVDVQLDVEHEVGADWAWATPDSPRRKSSAAATSMAAKTIQLREKPAMLTSRRVCRWDRR
jgi:hypothetical protein